MNPRELCFSVLRSANVERLPRFKNAHGDPEHSERDGSDWSLAQWFQAVIGELGEYANEKKKHDRGCITDDEFHDKAKQEIADAIIYIDLLAFRLGIDLASAVRDKWNAKSEELGIPMVIRDDWHFTKNGVEQINHDLRFGMNPQEVNRTR